MTLWLVIFILMSLSLNILQFKAYTAKEKEYQDLKTMYKDFEKIVGKYSNKFTKKGVKK